jgi:PcfJ-like protein
MRGDGTDRGGPERYGFLATVLDKLEGALPEDPGRLARWQEGYARARRAIHSEVFNEGEVEGMRAVAVQGTVSEVSFVGIRHDGVCVGGAVPLGSRHNKDFTNNPGVCLDDRASSAAFARVAFALVQGDRPQEGDLARVEPWNMAWESLRPQARFAFDTRGRDHQNDQMSLTHSVLRGTLGPDWDAGEAKPQANMDFDEDEIPFEEEDPTRRPFHRLRHNLRAPMMAQQRKAGRFIVHLLAKEADPEALRRMRGVADGSMAFYNHLVGVPRPVETGSVEAQPVDTQTAPSVVFADAFPPASPDLALRRQQALDLYPILARRTMGHSPERVQSVVEAIDAGKPFEGLLAQELAVPPALLRRMRGTTWQKAGRDTYYDTHMLIPALAGVAPEHMPTTQKGYRALKASVEAARGYVEAFPGQEKSAVEVLSGMAGRFDRAQAWRDNADPRGAADAASYVVNRAVRPLVYQEALAMGAGKDAAQRWALEVSVTGRDVLDDVFGHRQGPMYPAFWPMGKDPGIRRAAEVSHAWHRALPRLETDLVDPQMRNTQVWEPFFATKDLGKGWTAREVRDAPTMQMIGTLDDHCVGGYADRAEQGHCIIVEMLYNGERKSVAEVVTSSDPKEWKIRQNRAYGNSDPGKAAHGAASKLLRALRQEDPTEWRRHAHANNQAAAARRARQADADPESVLARTIGRAPSDRANADKAFETLRPFMDKRWSKMDPDTFRAQIVRPYVAQMAAAEQAYHRAEAARAQIAAQEQDLPAAAPKPRGLVARAVGAVRGFAR